MSLFSFFKKPQTDLSKLDPTKIQFKEKDDPQILSAKIEAQSKINAFIDALQTLDIPPDTYFSVKTPFEEDGIVEHMWVDITSYKDGVFVGTLGNDPEFIKKLKLGDPISVQRSDVEDWLVYNSVDKKHIGGFSFKAFGVDIPN